MALAKVLSGTTIGLDSILITVEVNIEETGFPAFTIVGLADKAVEESRERVRSAIQSCGLSFPRHRVTVNLTPADLPKRGASFDLPIALGILLASHSLETDMDISNSLFFGELSLDGELRHTPGAISLGTLVAHLQLKNLFLPQANASEASYIAEVQAFGLKNLNDLIKHFTAQVEITPEAARSFDNLLITTGNYETDFKDIRGQESAKRALEVAAAGSHNIAMKGPPGSGKTMLARALPSILPVLTAREAFEVTKVYSVTGNLPQGESFIRVRPFRSPHHTTSRIGLIGGGSHPTPGEISLAHRGVLFLDEFPELPRSTLEALRQPLEDGFVSVSRAAGTLTFPSKFMLVVASNPCPCGNLGHPIKRCHCSPHQIENYKKRISGPILDRIDIHVEVPSVELEKLIEVTPQTSENSNDIQKRVQAARNRQQERFKAVGITNNNEMTSAMVKEFCPINIEGTNLLKTAVANLGLSARGYFRVIKVARTIADLSEAEEIAVNHLAEALQYRNQQI